MKIKDPKEEKETCTECKGHGGTYDINPRNGDIVGIPCETCRRKEELEDIRK